MSVRNSSRNDWKRIAAAWKAWLESEEGKSSSSPESLAAPSRQRQYLENRLWRAFMAGATAASKRAPRKAVAK